MNSLVSVFMDVEDPINPLADDAALHFARVFTEARVRGSFCITGEKCRTLLDRGRTDVIEAFLPHCLGLHTNTHSFHPTTMERLADLSFEEGCESIYEEERKGFDAFYSAFGRSPSFWGGAGNTWSPEVTDTLKRLRIPAYVYAQTELPGEAAHQFNGVMAFNQMYSIGETDWCDDERALARSSDVLDRITRNGEFYSTLFVGHPTRFRYNRFWDVSYFAGQTPETPEGSEPTSEEEYARGQKNLLAFLNALKTKVGVIGVDEAVQLPWHLREPNAIELGYFKGRTAENLRGAVNWPIHRPDLDAENIVAKTLALADTLRVAEITPSY